MTNQNITKQTKNNTSAQLMTILPEKLKTTHTDPITVAFVLALASKQKTQLSLKELVKGDYIEDKALKQRAASIITEKTWEQVCGLLSEYTYQDFADFVLHYSAKEIFRQNESTPNSLIDLSIRLLAISKTDKVGDFGCGKGNFLIQAAQHQPQAYYYGTEIDTEAAAIAKMRAVLSGAKMEVEQDDIFNIKQKDFSKIFSNYPFAMPLRASSGGWEYMKKLQKACPQISSVTSSDWIFNAFISAHLTPTGKGIGIMTNGSTWNTLDASIRKYFVEQGLIRAIIALPSKLFFNTAIGTCLIVLGKANKSIRMIDASPLYKEERRQNILMEEHIDMIVKAMTQDTAYSREVSVEEIQAQKYVLFPGKYLKNEISLNDAVALKQLAHSITRAAALSATELDALISETPTDIQYLTSSDISKGSISPQLHFLKEIPAKCKNSIITDHCLVLTKNAPYKVAVVRVPAGKTILAHGNLYIIRLNPEKINGYYLQAFLESELGKKLLNQASVGAFIANLSLQAVNNLAIPLVTREIQDKIASSYQEALSAISKLRNTLAHAEKNLENIWAQYSQIKEK